MFAPTLKKVFHDAGIAEAVTFKLSPGIRGPEHTHAGYKCVDEQNCDAETYFLCAQQAGASVDFLACMDASSDKPAAAAKTCAAANSPALEWAKITSCFGGDEAKTLVANAATYFDKLFPQPVGVPHIEINGKAVDNEARSEADIIKALCATGIQAGACKNVLSYI